MSQILLDQVDPLGDTLAVNPPLYVSGNIWYVHSGTGDDNNSGKERKRPLATAAQAQTNGANGDIVFLLDGHAETLTNQLSLSKSITWVGCGLDSNGHPTVTFTTSTANGRLRVTGGLVELRNLKIVVGDGADGLHLTSAAAVNALIKGCRIECGNGANEGIQVSDITESLRIEDTTVVSTATDEDNLPGYGIDLSVGGVGIIWLTRVTLDGGTLGFSGGVGITGHLASPTIVHFRAEKLSLLNGADLDFSVGSAPTHYWIQIDLRTGGAQLRGLTGQYLPNGLGEASGDVLATDGPLYVSGNIWYVHSGTGTDAAAPAGKERLKPLATIAQATTNGATGDIVVLIDGHAETLSSQHVTDSGVTFVAGGDSATSGVTITCDSGGSSGVSFTTLCEVRNVCFVSNVGASQHAATLRDYSRMVGCRIECQQNATGGGVGINGGDVIVMIENTTIVVTASATPPGPGIRMQGAGVESMIMSNVTLDGGPIGFDGGIGMDAGGGSPPVTSVRATELSLLRGADIDWGFEVPASYWLQPTLVTGGSAIRTE